MLSATATTFAHSPHRRTHRPFVVAVLLIGCVLATARGAESGGAEFDVPFTNTDDGTFPFQTITNVKADVNGASSASLSSVTFEVIAPPGATLAFLDEVEGSVLAGDERITLVSLHSPKGTSAELTIDYAGDMRRFFVNGHDLTVDWYTRYDPSYAIPEGGITVHCDIAVRYTL
jgi:hypothetical protein